MEGDKLEPGSISFSLKKKIFIYGWAGSSLLLRLSLVLVMGATV